MTRKQEQFLFFYKRAGYAYDPKTQGRAAYARKLAEAERYFDAHSWRVEWGEDAVLYDAKGRVLASLGCGDPIQCGRLTLRRLIRAQLALKALEHLCRCGHTRADHIGVLADYSKKGLCAHALCGCEAFNN